MANATIAPWRVEPLPLGRLPADGESYWCPVRQCPMTVDGVIVEGETYWYGCKVCTHLVLADGTVMEVDKQWHAVGCSGRAVHAAARLAESP
jgi:hypothetical protein